MKIPVQAPQIVEEGKHDGTITRVEYRTKPFEYADVIIEFLEDSKVKSIKSGYPTMITPVSKLGVLLLQFGGTLEIGKDIDPAEILVGKRCEFMTMNKQTAKGTFAEVVSGSLKPCQ